MFFASGPMLGPEFAVLFRFMLDVLASVGVFHFSDWLR